MPLIKYIEKKFFGSSLKIIEQAVAIIADYKAQGYELTLRQLYYQFVTMNLIPNEPSEYKRLGSIINDARLAGLIDWNAIVDRTRNLKGLNHWDSPREIVDACLSSYRIDKWATQPNRIEVWIEKDALAGVIERACNALDVPFFSCRGYTSQSEMWVASQRLERHRHGGQEPIIIHLGDHDPSGIDMTRDIEDRLELFMGGLPIKRVALNMNQVKKYGPPPNPAKLSDSRCAPYIKKYGEDSWELDALKPQVIDTLVRTTILGYRNEPLWREAEALEREHKEKLQAASEALDD